MQTVSSMVPHDTAFVDPTRIEHLVRQIGTGAAERFVGRTLEDLAVLLNRLERAQTAGDGSGIVAHASALTTIADALGLVTVGRVADDVVRAIARGDEAALGAIIARLMRVGEQSLVAVWSAHDMSL